MPLNQLYHEKGVAQTLAQYGDTVESRAEHAAEAIRAHVRLRAQQTARTTASRPIADRFEVFRADEVRVTSTRFAGGDWRWRLADAADNTLVEGGSYRSELACLEAVRLLRERANFAT